MTPEQISSALNKLYALLEHLENSNHRSVPTGLTTKIKLRIKTLLEQLNKELQ